MQNVRHRRVPCVGTGPPESQGEIQQAATNDRPWYLGVHGRLLNGEEINFSLPDSYRPRKTLPMMGSTTGFGQIKLGEAWTLPIEMEAHATIPYTDEAR